MCRIVYARSARGGGNLELYKQGFRRYSYSEGAYPQESSLLLKLKTGLLRQKSRNDRFGFTLAEVLITLGIIGLVSAMTMPTLIANHREKETVVRLKKAYSTLSNAYIGVLDDYGDPTTWDVQSWDDVVVMFSKYIRNVKVCPSSKGGCFEKHARKDLTNNTVNQIGSFSSLVMDDGIVMGIDHQVGISSALPCTSLNYCFHFVVDINGDKLPNRWGVDTFILHVTKDKVIPRGAAGVQSGKTMCDPISGSGLGWYNGSGCGAWVIQMENLDYLKCVNGNQKYCSQKYYFQ